MGNFASAFKGFFGPKREVRILMVGLDGAGKTTILYKLKHGKMVLALGLNVETVEYKNINFTLWDAEAKDHIRPQWPHCLQNKQALIFVFDCSDRDRVDEARDLLHRMLNEDELRDAMHLVFANKQDLPNAMSTAYVSDKLGLHAMRQRNWHIEGSCA